MPLPHLRTLAALPLLIALGAVAAPPDRGRPEPKTPVRPKHHRQLPPQPPAGPMHMPGHPMMQHPPKTAEVSLSAHFNMAHRHAAQDYYAQPEHQGFVPPGLAKKGGMPPGQARLWKRGQALPAGVVWYALPRSLELVLGPPPAGHRYVRVATDILLIAIGTGIVVDAMEDLVR